MRRIIGIVIIVVAAAGTGCPRSSLVGAPCDVSGDEVCEGLQKLRCYGRQYVVLAPCHAECVDGPGTTHEQGTVDVDETWRCADSPHIVNGIVDIAPGATLSIEAGAEVRLLPSSSVDVDVDARVVIDATAGAPVLFTSDNEFAGGFATAATGGLNVFATASVEPSVIRHLIVERGQNGLGVFGLSSAATPPTIERSTFRDNVGFGIRVTCDDVDSPIPDFAAAGNLFFGNDGGDVSTCSP